jgi:xeroderma pigmentosum group C-complementing protein
MRPRLMMPGYSNSESLPSTPEAKGGPESSSESESEEEEAEEEEEGEEEEEEEEEWEDVLPLPSATTAAATGDLELTLSSAPVTIGASKKKGASLEERRIRVLTHCMHVQFLLFSGWLRNRWCCDAEVQAVLLSLVPVRVMRDIERAQEGGKGKGKELVGEPLLKPLGTLLHWWRGKFAVTEPALRKRGYRTQGQLAEERRTAEREGRVLRFGEQGTVFLQGGEMVEGLQGMRTAARECRGSRDTGAMLFTALCRALGWEARLVYSLQPLGFGFSAAEMATDRVVESPAVKKKAPPARKGKRKAQDGDSSDLSSLDSSSDETPTKQPAIDKDLLYPTFWTELLSPSSNTWITLSAFPSPLLGHTPDLTAKFEPRGKKAADAKQVIAYVVAYSSDGHARDVTARYLSKRTFPGKTKGFRIPVSEVPVYSYDGSIVSMRKIDWFSNSLRPYLKPREKWSSAEQREDEELTHSSTPEEKKKPAHNTNSVSGYKNHPEYILERHLKRDEAIAPGKSHVKTFTTKQGEEKVYLRADVVVCKAVENWYREGRTIRAGEQPLKQVKRRAVTLARKREIEAKQLEGETAMQGLYSFAQTELYTPPPIKDGVIPTNAFGNIDVYTPSMVPEGAVHLPLKGAGKIARKLGVSYADAVTGFEFRQQRATPYVEGIVVATENAEVIRDAWREAEEERKRREDGKREAEALARWRRFVLKARVLRRLRQEWGESHPGEDEKEINPFVRRDLGPPSDGRDNVTDEGGGFLPEDASGGGFLPEDEDDVDGGGGGFLPEDEDDVDGGGGFLLEEEENPPEGGGGFAVEIEEEEDEDSPAATVHNKPSSSTGVMSLREMVELASKPTEVSSEEEEEEEEEIRSEYFPPKKAAAKPAKSKPPPPQPSPARRQPRRKSKRIVSKYFASAAADDEDEDEDEDE